MPRRHSVIGFDDITGAAYTTPRLTTIRQPPHRMGEMAAQMLIKGIQYPKRSYPEVVMFEPGLMVRESTRRVRMATREKRATRAASNIKQLDAKQQVAKSVETTSHHTKPRNRKRGRKKSEPAGSLPQTARSSKRR